MVRSHHARAVLSALAVLSAGCAPEFDKVSEIETLRVLAVQKDKPYAKSGDEVTLSILWRDGQTENAPPRSVQLWWNKGCYNPDGDLFFSCFAPGTLTLEFLAPEKEQCGPPLDPPPEEPLGPCDNKLTFTLPDTLGQRPQVSDPTQPPYGLAYVFFAVCAGRLDFVQQAEARDFPIGCFDANNNRLGPDDFVAGYTSIYAYDGELNGRPITNGNPPLSGFIFKGKPASELQRCLGDECLSIPETWSNLHCEDASDPTPGDGSLAVPCVAPCEDDGDESCPSHEFRPEIVGSLSSYPEKDLISNATRGRDITEQMWINYYAERGGVKSEVRLLNDAFAGVNEDFGTEFWAPKEEGPTVIWAVVHDNRGGMSWVGMPILVKKPEATP
jgi:hypothetical protein